MTVEKLAAPDGGENRVDAVIDYVVRADRRKCAALKTAENDITITIEVDTHLLKDLK